MSHVLASPLVASQALAKLFAVTQDTQLRLSIREDRCFASGGLLELGRIRLRPAVTEGSANEDAYLAAVNNGFYEISFAPLVELRVRLADVLTGFSDAKRDRQLEKAYGGLRLLPAVLTRVGLLHPEFDAEALGQLPFTTPATVIADTSAIIGGSLDFTARFLYPLVRIKVPGIVHMELVNEVDNYFALRREDPLRAGGEAFTSHSKGIGGQGVLLRLELQNELEIERSSLFQDPLRHAFAKIKDTGSDLNITAPVRSYCDRLILEAARLHQAQVSPGHPIYLMTADQGLARMALAEGFTPLFCEPTSADALLPATLTGVVFDPFSGTLYGVPLARLVWELATSYGSVLLHHEDGQAVEIATLGTQLSWKTFHARQALRWMRSGQRVTDLVGAVEDLPQPERGRRGTPPVRTDREVAVRAAPERTRPAPRSEAAYYKFSAGGLLTVVQLLVERGAVDRARLIQVLNVKEGQLDSYVGFLRAGGFVAEGDQLTPTERMLDMFDAMRRRDFRRAEADLRQVASFTAFIRDLDERGVVPAGELRDTLFWRLPNYRRYGEACGRLLLIPGDGLYPTARDPTPEEFVGDALAAFDQVAAGSDYVLSGRWLEGLAREGIHPLVARDRLQQAHASGLLERYTRGATPDTRFEDHEFHTFEPAGQGVRLTSVHLYHGDFLIPERTSVELRLQRGAA